jgi:serine/threonine-protein kinase
MIIEACEWLGQAVGEGRFLIVRCLRDGGMSQIFLGEDKATGKSVIVKVPRLENIQYDANFLQRFQREIRALKRLAHPNIVRILCSGEERETPFVVLRYLEGGTLGDRMYTGPEQTPEAQTMEGLLSWLPTVAETLDYIHAKGYVHRDIKPHNILFDGEGKPFLGDLGIARILAATPDDGGALTRLGERPPGTPPYMSPEQICGQTGGAWSDQFALAVIVYEWLTGRRPFAGLNAEEVFESQRGRLMPIHAIRPEIPEAVSEAVARALARRPADRFPTCQELASDLMAAQSSTRLAAITGNPGSIATSRSLSPVLELDGVDAWVDNQPSRPATGNTFSPPTLPLGLPAPEPIEEPQFDLDPYNAEQSLPPAPPPPEPVPVAQRSRKTVIDVPVTPVRTRSWPGRMLRWSLVLLLIVSSGVGGRLSAPDMPGPVDDTRLLQIEEEKALLTGQLEARTSELREAQDGLDKARRDADRLREAGDGDATRAAERVKKVEERVTSLQKEIGNLGRETERLRQENKLLSKGRDESARVIEKLNKEKEALARVNSKAGESSREIARLNKRVEESTKEIVRLNKEKDESDKENVRLNKDKGQSDKAIARLNKDQEESRTLIERLNKEKEESDKEIARLNKDKEENDKAVAGLSKKVEESSKEMDRLSKKTEESNKEVARLNKKTEEIGKGRDDARSRVAAASRRARASEMERDKARQDQLAAQQRAAEAEKKAADARTANEDMKARLARIERTMKQRKLWFVLRNATDFTVRYQVRWQLWTGLWSEWKEVAIAKKEIRSISGPRGSTRFEVRHNASLVPGKKDIQTKVINAQNFHEALKPAVSDIDSVYAFEVSRDHKELVLSWK